MKLGKDYSKEWTPWFAWYPVKVRGRWCWLETILVYYNPSWKYWSYDEVQK